MRSRRDAARNHRDPVLRPRCTGPRAATTWTLRWHSSTGAPILKHLTALSESTRSPSADVRRAPARSPVGVITMWSRPSQTRIVWSSPSAAPATAAVSIPAHRSWPRPEALRLPIGFEVKPSHEPVANKQRQHVVTMDSFWLRNVYLDAIIEIEEATRAGAVPDERVKRGQQGSGGTGGSPRLSARRHVARLRPTLNPDRD